MADVVMFVLNDCRTDARVLREAGTLAAAGHRVTIMARTDDPYADSPEREARAGFEIVRVPVAAGALRWLLLARHPKALVGAIRAGAAGAVRRPPSGWLTLVLGAVGGIVVALLAVPLVLAILAARTAIRLLPWARTAWLAVEWRVQWRLGVMPWTAGAVAAAPDGDVFHAHDLRALPAAIASRDRQRERGREAVVVYDSHEVFVEAGANAARPRVARASFRRLEQRLAAEAASLVTVNDEVAQVLGRSLDMADRLVVVRNCVPRWNPPAPDPHLLRAATGVASGVPLVLVHGTFVAHRGFEQVALALRQPQLVDAHAVFLGRGPLGPALRSMAADPGLAGRVHVMDAVPPEDLLPWVHGADVVAVPIQPSTLNHRLSTPNKLFEALGAGVPVVASDFPAMRRIVLDDPDGPLGAVCDPTDPVAIATAIRSLLDLDPAARADLRARCLRAAHARYAWENEADRLLALYRRLVPPAAAARPS